MNINRIVRSLLFASVVISTPSSAWAQLCVGELCPGRIWNPPAFQWDMEALYIPTRDEYFMATTEWTFAAGGLVGRFLSPDGTLPGAVTTLFASGGGGVTASGMAYNSLRDEILLVARDASPTTIRARYLGSDGQPLGNEIVIGSGDHPHVAYSPVTDRYFVTWSKRIQTIYYTFYVVLDGDATNPAPILGSGTVDSNALSDVLVYNSVTQQFLVVYVKDLAPPRRADVYGRFFTAAGAPQGVFAIDASTDNQQRPQVAYASATNTFLVAYEDFGTGEANATASVLNAGGALIRRFTLRATSGWDFPGPMGYNAATETFIATWRTAFSDTVFDLKAQELNAADGTFKGAPVLISPFKSGLMAVATRPDAADPQAMILWRFDFGENGLRAGIMHLPAAPPQIQPPMPQGFLGVAYSGQIPVAGGTLPLSYEIVSGIGNLPAGLAPAADFATSGLIEGVATALGTSGIFRVRVTDADARADEEDLTLDIALAVPSPIGPTGAVNLVQPTYEWGASPGATSYNLVVENVTDGGVVLDQSSIPHVFPITSFTPSVTLVDGKTYRWRVRASDGVVFSGFSADTDFDVDTTAPQLVSDLAAAPPTAFSEVPVTAVDSSGEFSASFSKEMVTDGSLVSNWTAPVRSVLTTEFITVDLGSEKTIGQVRLGSRDNTAATFPVDFQIQVSTDGASFSTVLSVTAFAATANTLHPFSFDAINARYVKILVTKVTVYSDGAYYTQISEVQVDEAAAAPLSLNIAWTAPGDDGGVGQASSYDLRWSLNSIIPANFDSANVVPNVPSPSPAGTPEAVLFSGLQAETAYYFALKSEDDVFNVSPMSNLAVGVTVGIAPSPITDLSASNEQLTSIQLNWTAPGDDDIVGTAFAYVVRYSTSPITEANFSSATQVVTGVPSPAIAGTRQNATVTGLVSTTSYYFAIRTFDELGNTSFSNVLMAATLDDTPPAAVTDLAGTPGSAVPTLIAATAIGASSEITPGFGKDQTTDGDAGTFWTTVGSGAPQIEFITWDIGTTKSLMRLRLQSREVADLFPEDYQIRVSTDGATFVSMLSVTGASPVPGAWITHDFLPVNARYIQLWITKARQYTDNAYYVQMAEAEVFEAQVAAGAVTLTWTAPGDDGVIGTADMYDVRRSLFSIDSGNFDSATVVPAGSPLSAGSFETLAVNGLTDETRYYFAIKTKDEVPNTSGISNVITVDTPGTPPGAITTLAASNPTGTSVRLDWVATGDDGLVGQASSYEIRYSTSAILASNFASATLVTTGVPSPAASGTPQNMTVTGLSNETAYYFAMKTKDELDNASPLSNVVSATTLDVIAPAAVTDLAAAAGGFSYTPVAAPATDSSGDLAASVSKEKATDGDVGTFWSLVGTSTPQEEYLTVDTGAVRLLGRVQLTSRDTTNLFPEDFDIQISNDDVSYVTVASETGFVSSPGMSYTFPFTAAMGRYVKLRVTKARQYSDGGYYVQVAEMSVDEATSQADQVALSWTSPGDDGNVGTASSYELRYSTSSINGGNFPSAMLVTGVSAPQVAGSAETHVLSGLSAETLYYFGLKTKDEAPNESGLSNVAQVQTIPVPPAAVTDLAASGATTSSVDLDWTSTGDDGLVGQATSYEVRYSTSALTDENFGSATLVVSGVPSPSPSGQAESMTVTGLSAPTMYYFGLKVHDDDASGVSLLSNVVMLETLDNIAPSAVTDLTGGMGGSLVKPVLLATASSGDLAASVGKEKAVDGDMATFWSSMGTSTPQVEFLTVDTGGVRDLRQVDLIARNVTDLFPEDFELQVSENGVDFSTVVSETGYVAAPGSRSSFVFSSVFARYVRLRVTKARQYVDGGYYVQLAELEVYEFQSQAGSVLLSWTAPGDDGSVGQATSYDVRYSQSLITAGNFGSALEAVGEPSPSVAGIAESFVVTSLTAETGYYFALKTTDDSTNTSPISNVVMAYTPGTPPSSVTDLVASNPTNTTVKLDWTSTGDDGLVGTASSYEIRYSTTPITAVNFSGAMLVGSPPVPSVSGSAETKTVGGLTPGEAYYFALKVLDEAGNKSGLSNVAVGTTVDDIAPSTVTDLSATLGGVVLQDVPVVAVEASGELLPVTNVTDGDLGSFWSSLGSAVQREEFVTVDMGSMHLLGRVRLRSRSVTPELFPEDVVVEVSGDNVSFTPVHAATGLGIQASTWFTLDLAVPTLGRYVRIRVTKMRQYVDGGFYAQIAEVETLESVTSVNVTWTAPGDDGNVGTASSYDLRYSTSPISAANFDAATPAVGVPAPSVAGSAEAHTVGVLGGSTFYFALKTTDDDSNVSAISNLPSLVVP